MLFLCKTRWYLAIGLKTVLPNDRSSASDDTYVTPLNKQDAKRESKKFLKEWEKIANPNWSEKKTRKEKCSLAVKLETPLTDKPLILNCFNGPKGDNVHPLQSISGGLLRKVTMLLLKELQILHYIQVI